jgi:succinate dehydrogenase / fumarate reductase cytochrome b subunit
MADVNRGARPLSPHLSIYRPQINSAMSIFHRITGVGLTLGFMLGIWWFMGLAGRPERFRMVDDFLTGWFGGLIMILSMVALWYHFFSGLRHLIWDAGYWLELDRIKNTSVLVFAGTGVMSVITLAVALTGG